MFRAVRPRTAVAIAICFVNCIPPGDRQLRSDATERNADGVGRSAGSDSRWLEFRKDSPCRSNRTGESFDDLFHGFPGADTATYGYGNGVKYAMKAVSLANPSDIDHEHLQFIEDYDNGKNDGWDRPIGAFKTSCAHPWE